MCSRLSNETVAVVAPTVSQNKMAVGRGTALGQRLQAWSKANKRPLVWDGLDDNFFVDPTVNSLGGGSVTASDAAVFLDCWSQPSAEGLTSWMAKAQPHL